MSLIRSHILVCTGTGCTSSESPKIIAEFEKQLAAQGMDKEAQVVRTGCFGLCALGPIVTIYPEGACYTHVTVDDVEEIVAEHIVKGRIVKRLLNRNEGGDGPATSLAETRFYKHQHRIALRNCGVINPESIDEYIGVDGYAALGKILTEHIPPQQVIDTVLASGLRGRGGAGFPTGKKWQFTADAVSPDGVKYVCCNADEGDPGAFMDRSVLEGDPHTILEAMTIAGYAVGAHQGYIYVRAEYPIAVKRLETAIRQAKEYGLLGKNIFDSGFDFDLELRLGAGAFVCGEETALMRSIEGHRGEPKTRPPFPAVKGLFDRPTLLNNVETYANITWIFNHGPDAYAAIGTETSKGTKVFALGGKITNTGLVEVPMGTTLRTVVDEIGGGICQTSSTLYLACLRSNLEITERYAHRYVPAYITAGMDATVSWGGPDYKFTNNSLYPIKIVTIYENNYLTVRILGTNVDGTSVKMTNEHLSTTPYETVYEDDPTLAPGTEKVKTTPYTGYKYRTYRNVYDANGKLISSTYEATSDYKSRNKVILRGPAVEPADGGAQIPTDTTEPTTPVEPTEPQDPDVPAEPTEPTTPDNGWTIQTPEQDGQQTAEGQTGTGTTGESELSTDVLPQDEPFV